MTELRLPEQSLTLDENHGSRYLWAFLATSLVLQMAVFLLVPSVYRPDEIQYQEAAHRIAYGIGVIPWEYRLGARSWILPGIIAAIMKATAWLASGSSGYIFGTALFFALISLTVVWFPFVWCRRYLGMPYALLAGFTAAIWWEFIHLGPRSLNEFVAGNLLLPAIYLGSLEPENEREKKWRLFGVGILLGFTVALRMQLGPAVLLAGLWIMSRDWKVRFLPVAGGIAIVVLLFGFVDYMTWAHPFYSYYADFREDIVNRRAARFGTFPWYYYFGRLLIHAGPMALFALAGVRRAPILGWICLAILVPHMLIGHKEYRFIYPLLPLMLTLASIGLLDCLKFLERKMSLHISQRAELLLAGGFALACSLALAVLNPSWTLNTGDLRAFSQLSKDDQACGVAIRDVDWTNGGEYTYLHRPIPIFVFSSFREADPVAGSFNRVVVPESSPMLLPGYSEVSCRNGVCLYQREGSCQVGGADYEINEFLKKGGQ